MCFNFNRFNVPHDDFILGEVVNSNSIFGGSTKNRDIPLRNRFKVGFWKILVTCDVINCVFYLSSSSEELNRMAPSTVQSDGKSLIFFLWVLGSEG